MKVKYLEDYIDELCVYFPQIERAELKRMVEDMTTRLTYYMRKWHRGFTAASFDTLTGVPGAITVARIFSKHHLNNMKKAFRTRYKVDKNGKAIK